MFVDVWGKAIGTPARCGRQIQLYLVAQTQAGLG